MHISLFKDKFQKIKAAENKFKVITYKWFIKKRQNSLKIRRERTKKIWIHKFYKFKTDWGIKEIKQ